MELPASRLEVRVQGNSLGYVYRVTRGQKPFLVPGYTSKTLHDLASGAESSVYYFTFDNVLYAIDPVSLEVAQVSQDVVDHFSRVDLERYAETVSAEANPIRVEWIRSPEVSTTGRFIADTTNRRQIDAARAGNAPSLLAMTYG